MDPLTWGVVGFVAVLVLLALGVHVGLALALVGFAGIVGMTGSVQLGLGLLTTTPYSTTAVFAFTVLPLFIIMGLFATHAGMSGKAFDAAYKWVGRLPGGLAIATTWANALSDIPGEWIREMEAKKLAGRRIMVRYLELLEEKGHTFPRKWAADYR